MNSKNKASGTTWETVWVTCSQCRCQVKPGKYCQQCGQELVPTERAQVRVQQKSSREVTHSEKGIFYQDNSVKLSIPADGSISVEEE
jgi:methionyl-tRNA synthetase